MLDTFRKRNDPSPFPRSSLGNAPAPSTPVAAARAPEPAAPAPPAVSARSDAPPSPESDPARGTASKLIVGTDILLKGAEITACDTLVVEGRVEAAVDSRVIQVAESGVYVGSATVDVAEISGRFEGELTVRRQLLIRASGQVSGKIRYGRLAVEDGGEIGGDVAAIDAAQPRPVRAAPESAVATTLGVARPEASARPERPPAAQPALLAPR